MTHSLRKTTFVKIFDTLLKMRIHSAPIDRIDLPIRVKRLRPQVRDEYQCEVASQYRI